MLYSSVSNAKIKEIKKLGQKKYRDHERLFLVEGEHLVLEAHKTSYLQELLLKENAKLELPVPTNYLTDNVIKFISNLETPAPIMGLCTIPKGEIKGERILILEDIQDPGNLGTIIRSAVAFNVDTIILSTNTVDAYSPKVVRASQGMLFYINIVRTDIEKAIENLKLSNYKIYGTKVDNGKLLKALAKVEKFAIIMGNEGSGVSLNLLKLCDEYVYIPMNKACESLNVAVATSIILYELGGENSD